MGHLSQEKIQILERGSFSEPLAARMTAQRKLRIPKQAAITLLFLNFQDDLLELAVGRIKLKIFPDVERSLICGDIAVELSKKQEINMRFFT